MHHYSYWYHLIRSRGRIRVNYFCISLCVFEAFLSSCCYPSDTLWLLRRFLPHRMVSNLLINCYLFALGDLGSANPLDVLQLTIVFGKFFRNDQLDLNVVSIMLKLTALTLLAAPFSFGLSVLLAFLLSWPWVRLRSIRSRKLKQNITLNLTSSFLGISRVSSHSNEWYPCRFFSNLRIHPR